MNSEAKLSSSKESEERQIREWLLYYLQQGIFHVWGRRKAGTDTVAASLPHKILYVLSTRAYLLKYFSDSFQSEFIGIIPASVREMISGDFVTSVERLINQRRSTNATEGTARLRGSPETV